MNIKILMGMSSYFLSTLPRFTAVCEGEKEKATTDFARLSPSVGMRRVIVHVSASPKSWLLENDNMLIR